MTTIAKVQGYTGVNSFILKMKDVLKKYGSLTANQQMAVEKIMNATAEVKQVEMTPDMKKIASYEGQNSFVLEIKGKLSK